jgi:hypothetical protein
MNCAQKSDPACIVAATILCLSQTKSERMVVKSAKDWLRTDASDCFGRSSDRASLPNDR